MGDAAVPQSLQVEEKCVGREDSFARELRSLAHDVLTP